MVWILFLMIAAFLTTILFSISAIYGNRTAKILGGNETNFWRLIIATIALAAFAYSFGKGLAGVSFPLFFLSGCIGMGLGDVALFQTLPRLGARLTILLVHCLTAPFAGLVEWAWMGTALTPIQILFGMIILIGVSIALVPHSSISMNRRTRLIGIMFGILAGVGQGCGAVLSRKAFAIASSAHETIDGITAAYQRILGGVLIAAIFLLIIKFRELKRHDRPSASMKMDRWKKGLPYLFTNALAGPAIGVSCYQWALKSFPAGIVLPIVATTPIVIMPLAHFLEKDSMTTRSVIGGAIAVGGAIALAIVS
jgi:drug/metabolite transporter (DMT)-like permease